MEAASGSDGGLLSGLQRSIRPTRSTKRSETRLFRGGVQSIHGARLVARERLGDPPVWR